MHKWYATWRFDEKRYLTLNDGDPENGPGDLEVYVGEKPTYFRTKAALRKAMASFGCRGVFIIHRED